MLRFIGNVIWLLLAGLPLAIGYALFGLVAIILIITIPFGIASFRPAGYALWPFGRTIVPRPDPGARVSDAPRAGCPYVRTRLTPSPFPSPSLGEYG